MLLSSLRSINELLVPFPYPFIFLKENRYIHRIKIRERGYQSYENKNDDI